jgi:tetratricopeptide (TPR) repeat protein
LGKNWNAFKPGGVFSTGEAVNKRFLLKVLVCFLCCGTGWAQRQNERPYWFFLEQGKLYFRNGAYGDALIAFEDARRTRRTMYTRMEQDMIELLSLTEVRRLGDSLELLETYIAERKQEKAASVLAELYYRVPKASLENSVNRALQETGRLKDYPEAEYWIGEIYRAEGELGIALDQYRKAYEQREFLETPEFEVEILYKIVDILKTREDYNEMVRWAEEILEGTSPGGSPRDTLWAGASSLFTVNAMSRIMETGGINRFLTIYRYNNSAVEAIHRILGFYYYASGRYDRAVDHLQFAFLIQNTLLIEELIRNRFDFTFTTLEGLLADSLKRPPLAEYIEEVEYYKTLYYLGSSLYAAGKLTPAREFWTFLSRHPQAGEWRVRARNQLRSPFIEAPREKP